MNRKVFVAKNELTSFLEELSRSMKVWVPAALGDNTAGIGFQPFRPGLAPVLERPSTLPPKAVLLPQVEPLLRFRYEKDPREPARSIVRLESEEEIEPALVFGARPCDVQGFEVFDLVFTGGAFVDPIYRRRREKTLFATLLCGEADSACFCSAVGSGPADRRGSDLWIIPLDDGWLIEAVQERAAALLDLVEQTASEAQQAAAQKAEQDIARRQVGGLDLRQSGAAFLARFQDRTYWQQMAGQCLSCGICTFLCPTCYCFSITDEVRDLDGERIRSWDSCLFYHYTAEASGHNPRPTKLERYRNRIGHKFSYFPEKYAGRIACCGCGRCIRNCPVSLDIRRVVQYLKEDACVCA